MTLTGFPLDSTQIGYHEDGLPAYSSEYSSKNYRDVLAALISDGVIARVGNALKVEFADEQQHMNATASLTMTSGAAVKGGCMCITKGETVSVTAPQITGDETVATKRTAIGIAFYGDGLSESTTADESVEIDVKSSSGQPSYASNALYMAEVISKTVKHSGGTYSYSHEIQDLRASEHCGFSAPFVDIDLSSFYDNVNEAINSYSMEIIENIALLKGWTQTAVELAQDALDGTVAGNIYTRLDALEADGSVTTARIADDAVDNDKLAENAVDTENVVDGSIIADKLSESLQNILMKKSETPQQVTSTDGKAKLIFGTIDSLCGVCHGLASLQLTSGVEKGGSISFENAYGGKQGVIIGDSIIGTTAPGGKLWCTTLKALTTSDTPSVQIIYFE